MDFTLSEEHRMIQQSIRKFCERELDPIAGQIDQDGRFPMDVYRKLGQEYGGSGMDLMSTYVIKEELCRSVAAMGVSVTIWPSEIQKLIIGRVLMKGR